MELKEKLNKNILLHYLEIAPKKCLATVMLEMQREISKTVVLLHYYEIEVMCRLYDYCVVKNNMPYEEFKAKFLGNSEEEI